MTWGFMFLFVIFILGFIGSFISGMVGIGGAIVNYPMLLYIPPLFGFHALTAHQVSGIVAVQVLFATLSGVLASRKGGLLNKQLILTMGLSVLVGSLLGSFGSGGFSEKTINLIYGILALVAVLMMVLPKKGLDETRDQMLSYNRFFAGALAFIVGVSAGIVGAGGAFILVPIMLVVLKIPTRITIATSLAVTFISSIGATIGKVTTGQVEYLPALLMVVASLIAAPIGVKIGGKLNTKMLQMILAVLILGTSIKIWWDIFN